MNSTLKMLRPALVGFALLSAVTGLLYPAAVTGVARTLFPFQAEGSLVLRDGRVIGSELIGQSFSSPRYFWGRPSATAPMANNATGSSGSNQGPTNPALVDAVKARVEALKLLTLWPAYAAFQEKERGSIEVGKLADFTVLSADIMQIPSAQILETRVLMTIIGGEVAHKAGQ